MSSDKEFLHQVHLREIALSDYNTAINDAKDEGRLEGRLEGNLEGKLEIAINLIKMGLPVSQISKCTGFDIDKIEALRKNKL